MANAYCAYYQSPIGRLKITTDGECITELSFTDEKEYNDTVMPPLPGALLAQCTTQLTEFFAGKRTIFTVPLRQEGTPFQQKVWQALQAIAFGKTVSYLWLAQQLGDAKAVRAVAAGNGKNKIAILIPCHRVVGSRQALVGYRWGTARKQWLLQHEAKHTHGVQTLFEPNASN